MTKKLLGHYTNGNYEVMIWNDGSKLRFNDKDNLTPEFPESIDCKISNKCDMGCPFCHEMSVPDGALANSTAEAAMPTVHAVVDFAARNDFDIFYTKDTHYADFYMDSQEGKNLPVPHCIFQTPGWNIDKRAWATNPTGLVQILTKPTFGYEDWSEEDLNLYNEIVVIGFCTDICVITNALLIKTTVPETPIVIIEDACAGVTPEKHMAALETMRSCQISVMKWEQYAN